MSFLYWIYKNAGFRTEGRKYWLSASMWKIHYKNWPFIIDPCKLFRVPCWLAFLLQYFKIVFYTAISSTGRHWINQAENSWNSCITHCKHPKMIRKSLEGCSNIIRWLFIQIRRNFEPPSNDLRTIHGSVRLQHWFQS